MTSLEHVQDIGDLVFIPLQKLPVWVRHDVLISTRKNIEVFPKLEEGLFWDRTRDITSGIGFPEINHVLQYLAIYVSGRGRMV